MHHRELRTSRLQTVDVRLSEAHRRMRTNPSQFESRIRSSQRIQRNWRHAQCRLEQIRINRTDFLH